jgi:LPXTG-site transpeptidase (sortase) family protein
MSRIPRRVFLRRWTGNALLAAGGSLFGAVAARQGFAELGIHNLNRLNAGRGAELYRARSRSSTPPAARAGGEPPLFVAGAPTAKAPGPGAIALTFAISSIDLRSDCVELGTQVVDGQLVWKTPDHAVGHHMGTASPGQAGNSVFSGHISSPLSHEGNVFHRLPELASKLGSQVQIVLEGGRKVQYQVVGTQVVTPADTWVMDPTDDPVLTLITCVPDGIYTHRFIASATLVS